MCNRLGRTLATKKLIKYTPPHNVMIPKTKTKPKLDGANPPINIATDLMDRDNSGKPPLRDHPKFQPPEPPKPPSNAPYLVGLVGLVIGILGAYEINQHCPELPAYTKVINYFGLASWGYIMVTSITEKIIERYF